MKNALKLYHMNINNKTRRKEFKKKKKDAHTHILIQSPTDQIFKNNNGE